MGRKSEAAMTSEDVEVRKFCSWINGGEEPQTDCYHHAWNVGGLG